MPSTIAPAPKLIARLHPSRAAEVYEQLKRDVSDFKLVTGDRSTETEISKRLCVPRTPVRQALFKLQQEGSVEVMFRSGWRVLPFDFDHFEELYDLRQLLETTATCQLCNSTGNCDQSRLAALAAISDWLKRRNLPQS